MSIHIILAPIQEKNHIYKALIQYSIEIKQFQENPTQKIASEQYFDYYWTESHRFPIVAYKEDQFLGFCLLRSEKKYYDIAEFYIKPKFRGHGYGKKLLDFTIELCQKQGFHTTIIANSHIDNLRANKFWLRNGFTRIKEIVVENERYYCNLKTF
jgi:ribosomal protein S18 acetylase RimI-like enzyme